MNINKTIIPDCIHVVPNHYDDNRGIFSEIFKHSQLPSFSPVQSNYSSSKKGVLRGIHRVPYAKYVTCVVGKIYDVCVDLRSDSLTYGQYFGIELDSKILNSLYIPGYCGHGFLAIEDSVVIYQQDGEYNPAVDETYCYSNYDIEWPFNPTIISEKDMRACEKILLHQ